MTMQYEWTGLLGGRMTDVKVVFNDGEGDAACIVVARAIGREGRDDEVAGVGERYRRVLHALR